MPYQQFGPSEKKTAAELKSVLYKDNDGMVTAYHIPTLEKVLCWGKGQVLFTLDVKRSVPYRMMVDAVRRNMVEANSVEKNIGNLAQLTYFIVAGIRKYDTQAGSFLFDDRSYLLRFFLFQHIRFYRS